jgi:hypothetical protein
MPLGEGTELRSRTDRYGHVLVWPSGSEYRSLPPGAARTLLGERRIDVVPLVRGQASPSVDGPHRLGLATKKIEIVTKTGKVVLEQAKIADAGDGGLLLCRLLTELIAIDPAQAPCASDDVPLRAQYTWPSGGSITFEAFSITHRLDMPAGQLLVPPLACEYAPGALPPTTTGVFLTRDEMAAFRTRALDLGPSVAPGAPGEGLLAFNGTDLLRFLWLDGVAIAWVAPGKEQYVIGAPRGRYQAQWRTFLGDIVDLPRQVELPARLVVGGGSDGGAPASAPRDK